MSFATQRQRLFDPEKPLFALRELHVGDIVYNAGEPFPWKHLDGLTKETVQTLFNVRHVSHFAGGDSSAEAMNYYNGAEEPKGSRRKKT